MGEGKWRFIFPRKPARDRTLRKDCWKWPVGSPRWVKAYSWRASRHLRSLTEAREHLKNAAELAGCDVSAWSCLRKSYGLRSDRLSSITGEFGADDLLGEIFSRFCIGK